MKNINWCVFCLFICLISCNNDIIQKDVFATLDTSVINVSDSVVCNSLEKYYVNEKNELVFKSVTDYFELTDSLINLTSLEYQKWAYELNFKSYRLLVDSIVKELIDNDNGIMPQKYSKFIKMDNGGDFEPIIQAQSYCNIMNEDGIFYIGSVMHKIDEFYVTIMDVKDKTRNVRRELYQLSKNARSSDNVIDFPEIQYMNRDKDRAVITWGKIYKNIVSNLQGGITSSIDFDIVVRPRKYIRFIVGSKWKDYNTICYVDEVRVHMPGLGLCMSFDENGNMINKQDEVWFLKTVTSVETPRLTSTYRLKSFMTNMPDFLQPPVCIHYRARTRGTGKYGAAYNVYNPLPGMSNCGHRAVTEYQYTQY